MLMQQFPFVSKFPNICAAVSSGYVEEHAEESNTFWTSD
jgi:hypothetical protein